VWTFCRTQGHNHVPIPHEKGLNIRGGRVSRKMHTTVNRTCLSGATKGARKVAKARLVKLLYILGLVTSNTLNAVLCAAVVWAALSWTRQMIPE